MATTFVRISKREAFKRFCEDKPIHLCPHKLRAGYPWNPACLIMGRQHLEQAERYRTDPVLWKGSVEKTAWEIMYANWEHYNASHEAGYYAAYYVEVLA